MSFVRPASLKFPQIYGTFKANDKTGTNQVEYVIQDLPEGNFEEALSLLAEVFLPDEALYKSRGLVGNADATKEARAFWRSKLDMKTSLACFQSGSSELAGLYVLAVVSEGDISYVPKNEALRDVFAAHNFVWNQRDNAMCGSDKYLTDYGLVIGRDYRQRGLAGEFLKARIALTKLIGVEVTSSLFTATASQKAAEKAGYTTVVQFAFSELATEFPAFDFSKAEAKYAKIMDKSV